jgi:calsyntenin 1
MQEFLVKGKEYTKDLSFDEGTENIFHFDGSNGAILPKDVIDVENLATQPFTMQTVFRHQSIVENDKLTKEHIICSADSYKMNRHHFALFVRHCRLILLIRKNSNDGTKEKGIFTPAEWRWKIPQVCDNEWHHYTLTADGSKVDLYIDGEKFIPNQDEKHSNPEVIDDWPLHPSQGINTTLTIGACFQSSENRLKHGFVGDISSVKMTLNKVLSEDEIKCGIGCAERLLSPEEKYMKLDQEVQMNSQMNEITIEGTNKHNIEQLVQKIRYINEKSNPTIGRRNINIITTVSCPKKKAIRLPPIDTFIMINDGNNQQTENGSTKPALADSDVQSEWEPKITITGNQNKHVSHKEIKSGVKFLESVNIVVYSNDQIEPDLQKLDSCTVNGKLFDDSTH